MGTVVVAAIVLVATTVLVLATNGRVGIDASVHHWVVHHSSPALRDASQVGKQPGTRWVYYACALAAALCGLWARRSVRAVVIAVAAVAIETVLLLAMKVAIGRGAPSSGTLALRVGGESFPSGHAANPLLALGLLGWWLAVGLGGTTASRRLAVALPLVVSGVTGVSMLLLDYHWLTDNVAGWAAGTLALCGAIWWDCRVPRPEWAQRRRARGPRATGSQPVAGRGRLSAVPDRRGSGWAERPDGAVGRRDEEAVPGDGGPGVHGVGRERSRCPGPRRPCGCRTPTRCCRRWRRGPGRPRPQDRCRSRPSRPSAAAPSACRAPATRRTSSRSRGR